MAVRADLAAESDLTHARATARRPRGGWLFFALMVAGWVAVFALMADSEPTLGDLHAWVRDLPMLLELLVWFLLFPFVLALSIWTTEWQEWLRFALVACCAVGWSLAFYPRPKQKEVTR